MLVLSFFILKYNFAFYFLIQSVLSLYFIKCEPFVSGEKNTIKINTKYNDKSRVNEIRRLRAQSMHISNSIHFNCDEKLVWLWIFCSLQVKEITK
jgi:hypothetical protein